MTVRIVVAYKKTLIRQGIAAILRQHGYEIVGEPASGEELQRLAMHMELALVLAGEDLCSPDAESHADVIACIHSRWAHCAVIVLENPERRTSDEFTAARRLALQRGAVAYLPLDLETMELLRIVRTVLSAHGCQDGIEITESRVPTSLADAPTEPHSSLTARETEIVSLIVGGLCNKEIAHRLDIGPQTVKNHVHHLLEKLGFADRTQLAVWALEEGIVKHGG